MLIITNQTNSPQGVRILSLDAKDIYLSNNFIDGSEVGYNIRNKNGDINTRKFINVLDYSLDLIKLRETYEKIYRRMDFGFYVGKYEYTQRVINVTFKYTVKEYNEIRRGLYIKNGYSYNNIKLENGCDIRGTELIAIDTNVDVDAPLCDDELGQYFYYENGKYHAKQNIKVVKTKSELREELYKDGFICNGIHFIRFKRSAGSSRVGKCLFIDEKLYPRMHKWEMCGIKASDGQAIDLAALEAYIALTLSSIVGTIEINPENILVIDDFESTFKDKAIAVREGGDGKLTAGEEVVDITNSIWDGQSLIDISLMENYKQYGMILLRNRFFKSCCFNCNVQEFFKANNITDIAQLKGFTLAKCIEDVKVITTPSSIKYVKFGTLQEWMECLDPIFGVVKHEKKTHFFDGRMVQTHYQLINTLQLDEIDIEDLLEPSLKYIKLINNDPAVLRYHIKYPADEEFVMPMTALESKNDIVYKLLGMNDKFAKTKMYAEFKHDLVQSMIKNLRKGHILVNGNYETLLGNPVEMLLSAIGRFDGESILGVGNVHTRRFEYDRTLLCSRSPHVNPGNVLLVENVKSDEIDTFFNLTEEIVCINAIGENIQQRLNGADYDSDTIMITDNFILIDSARKNYDKFAVPTNFVSAVKLKRTYTDAQKADLDVKTSVNKIGEIINLSQELNSLMWDMLNNGSSFDDVREIYYDSSKLCIASNLAIDSAKKEFKVSITKELKILKTKYCRRDKDGRLIKPNFFAPVARFKGYYDPVKKNYMRHKTSMDYLQHTINCYKYQNRGRDEYIPFYKIFDTSQFDRTKVNYKQIERVENIIRQEKEDIKKLWASYFGTSAQGDGRFTNAKEYVNMLGIVDSVRKDCVQYIDNIRFNYSTMYWLLKGIEDGKLEYIHRDMFGILFGAPNKDFYQVIKQSAEPIRVFSENDSGLFKVYDIRCAYSYNK